MMSGDPQKYVGHRAGRRETGVNNGDKEYNKRPTDNTRLGINTKDEDTEKTDVGWD